ncbi:hypothetical protein J3459_011902 [Metarhizium acridum]|uniref:Uncharacterized protein n=1 Tax=Metarhizium acridum (strain CQMa 102) TaxID=655827 RepID=E9DZB4_METAQ|nr:uncharacterized protein MAC_02962 [Metarhizium acridum CQMa 102]EFY91076.1 hypothetical protein MAC_02962 [Metarhizium acridum CQMa 102]KAG8418922.1 hypothetical protein J3459_011902 [Metarhizium acridum]
MGLIKTLIVSSAAVAVAKEFSKKRQDKKHSRGQYGQDQLSYGPPPPQEHQGHGQPNHQQCAPQGPPLNYYSQSNANQALRPEKWSKF